MNLAIINANQTPKQSEVIHSYSQLIRNSSLKCNNQRLASHIRDSFYISALSRLDLMKPTKSTSDRIKKQAQKLIGQAVAAEQQAEVARREVRLAKAKLKQVRKVFRRAKKAAKQARKKARDSARRFMRATQL